MDPSVATSLGLLGAVRGCFCCELRVARVAWRDWELSPAIFLSERLQRIGIMYNRGKIAWATNGWPEKSA